MSTESTLILVLILLCLFIFVAHIGTLGWCVYLHFSKLSQQPSIQHVEVHPPEQYQACRPEMCDECRAEMDDDDEGESWKRGVPPVC